MPVSDSQPVSAGNLKALVGGFLGGVVLFQSSSGATSGTLSRDSGEFSHLLVTASAYSGKFITITAMLFPGQVMYLGNGANFSECQLTISGGNFSLSDAHYSQKVYSIIGFNFVQ